MTDTEQRLRKLLCDHLGAPRDFPWTADLMRDLGADSLDFIEVAMAIEEEFDLQIDDDRVFAWRTAWDVLGSVKEPV